MIWRSYSLAVRTHTTTIHLLPHHFDGSSDNGGAHDGPNDVRARGSRVGFLVGLALRQKAHNSGKSRVVDI